MSQSQTESAIYSSRHYIHQHTLRRYLLAWFEPRYQISNGPMPNQVRLNNIHPCGCTFVCSRYHRQPGSESTGKPRAANLDSGKWHHQIEPMFASSVTLGNMHLETHRPARMPDRMSECMPHRLPSKKPDRMSGSMPHEISDRMPDRIPVVPHKAVAEVSKIGNL